MDNVALPARVLDLGDGGPAGGIKLHLSSPLERDSYTALSYCWGTAEQLTTTTATLPLRVTGILFQSLPQAVRDAVTVTRGLRIRFLWVDALCIVQDDAADKRAEIQKMGSIYRNSALTIQAAVSASVQEGFLHVPECRIPILSPTGDFMTLSITTMKETLRDRAWTFQEEVLSPRKLYFGARSILFDCPTSTCEYHNYNFQPTGKLLFPAALPYTVFSDHLRYKKPRRSLGKMWADAVRAYSKRSITYPADRLPALAGIAQEFSCMLGPNDSDYWAGMWRKFAVRHLGWRTRPSRGLTDYKKIDIRHCQRPSWSWVSLVDANLEDIEIETDDVFEENAELVGWPSAGDEDDGDDRGAAAFTRTTGGGLLRLRGKMTSFNTPPRPVPWPWIPRNDWGSVVFYDLGEDICESDYRYFLLGRTAKKSVVGLILVLDRWGSPDDKSKFLRIGQFRIAPSASARFVWDVEEREVVLV